MSTATRAGQGILPPAPAPAPSAQSPASLPPNSFYFPNTATFQVSFCPPLAAPLPLKQRYNIRLSVSLYSKAMQAACELTRSPQEGTAQHHRHSGAQVIHSKDHLVQMYAEFAMPPAADPSLHIGFLCHSAGCLHRADHVHHPHLSQTETSSPAVPQQKPHVHSYPPCELP